MDRHQADTFCPQLLLRQPRLQQLIARGLLPISLVAAALPGPLRAQTVPDAGALRQQIEQGRTPALPKKALTELAPEPEPMQDPGGAAELMVKEFQVRGNTLMSTPELQESLKPYLDRAMSFAELRGVAAKVGVLYRKRGWVVRAYLPQQEVKDGVFIIQVVEAMYGQTRIEDATTRLPQARVQATVDAAQPAGTALNADRLDRALLLLNDMPGVMANGTLVSGKGERETDLVLRMGDKPLTRSEISVDNAGSRSTGEARLNGNLAVNSPFRMGEQFTLSSLHSKGSNYARAGATLPIGNNGLRVGANGSIMKYELVSDQFAGLGMQGTSTSAGLEASYPLLRSRLANAYVAAYYDHRNFDNEAMGVLTSKYGIDSLTLSLSGNAFDALGGGGVTSGSFGVVSGKVDLNGSANAASDAATTNTAGNFTKLRYSLARQQFLTDTWSVYGALSGQGTQKNLDSSEKFYLGGANGVRAYPTGEGGGSEGQIINLEIRAHLPWDLQLTGFYDWGRVVVNHDNNFPGAATINRFSLQGAGMALAWAPRADLIVRATWARRIGANPNATASGNDQDGTAVINRFWLQGIATF